MQANPAKWLKHVLNTWKAAELLQSLNTAVIWLNWTWKAFVWCVSWVTSSFMAIRPQGSCLQSSVSLEVKFAESLSTSTSIFVILWVALRCWIVSTARWPKNSLPAVLIISGKFFSLAKPCDTSLFQCPQRRKRQSSPEEESVTSDWFQRNINIVVWVLHSTPFQVKPTYLNRS